MQLSWLYIILAIWCAIIFYFAHSFFLPLLDTALLPSGEAITAGGFIMTVGLLWASVRPINGGSIETILGSRLVFCFAYIGYEIIIGREEFGLIDWLFLSICCVVTLVPGIVESRRLHQTE
ncbi:MAG: hypothetical protein CMQ46_08840 [Gammaproteobacteria bacterium]|nr:hypothetical protein [Gammaproteobacteria bacterium]MBJ55352.1 hypothetical protein [Gammaproteobacteria bacterium]HBN15929.1 hypothetical protein [Pseudohongiella sp.]